MATYSSLPAYVNSSFLKKFVSEEGIGWVYAGASVITIILMLLTPWLIKRYGNRQVLIWFTSLSLASIVWLLLSPLASPAQKVIHSLTAFTIYIVLGYLTRYTLDVYLENISDNKGTGLIRGLYLTFYNLAWLVSPFLAAYLASTGNFSLVYGVAGLALTPLLIIAVFKLNEPKKIKDDKHTIWRELKYLWASKNQKAKNIYNILVVDFLLNFFYAVMVVYMPIYLLDHIGLSWQEMGLAFTIMLLPFVLFELPLGRIADKWLGEKEILLGGLVVISLATIACSILDVPSWCLWTILLFFTRTGASTIEIMKETYLFKKLDGADAGIVALSRINVPFSYLIGPIFVSLILLILDFRFIFLLLGLIMLLGLKFAWELKDTK